MPPSRKSRLLGAKYEVLLGLLKLYPEEDPEAAGRLLWDTRVADVRPRARGIRADAWFFLCVLCRVVSSFFCRARAFVRFSASCALFHSFMHEMCRGMSGRVIDRSTIVAVVRRCRSVGRVEIVPCCSVVARAWDNVRHLERGLRRWSVRAFERIPRPRGRRRERLARRFRAREHGGGIVVVRVVREVFGTHRSRDGNERAFDFIGTGGDQRANAGFTEARARARTRRGNVGSM